MTSRQVCLIFCLILRKSLWCYDTLDFLHNIGILVFQDSWFSLQISRAMARIYVNTDQIHLFGWSRQRCYIANTCLANWCVLCTHISYLVQVMFVPVPDPEISVTSSRTPVPWMWVSGLQGLGWDNEITTVFRFTIVLFSRRICRRSPGSIFRTGADLSHDHSQPISMIGLNLGTFQELRGASLKFLEARQT